MTTFEEFSGQLLDELDKKPCCRVFVRREDCHGECGKHACDDEDCDIPGCHDSHYIYRDAKPGEQASHASVQFRPVGNRIEARCIHGCVVSLPKPGK